MEEYKKVLQDYGLSPNEVRVYLAMLRKDYHTVLQISKGTEIKRPTVYVVLEGLINKGLVKITIKGKKKIYVPEKPKNLLKILDQRKESIEAILPFLEEQYIEKSEQPKMSFYEGIAGIKKVYNDVIRSKTEVLWFGSAQELKDEFSDIFLKIDKIEEINPDYKGSREIVNNTKFDKDYAKEIIELNDPKTKARILPGELFFLGVDNIIYDNKVVMLSIKNDYFAVVIESRKMADGFRCMFELAWKSAVKP